MPSETVFGLTLDHLPLLLARVVLNFVVGAMMVRVACWLHNRVAGRFNSPRDVTVVDDTKEDADLPAEPTSWVPVPGLTDAFYLMFLSIGLCLPMMLAVDLLSRVAYQLTGLKWPIVFAVVRVVCSFWIAHTLVLRWLLTTTIWQAARIALISTALTFLAIAGVTGLIRVIPWDYFRLVYQGLTT